MHTNVILTNKRRTDEQSNYTNTKLKAWFSQETAWAYSAPRDSHGAGGLINRIIMVRSVGIHVRISICYEGQNLVFVFCTSFPASQPETIAIRACAVIRRHKPRQTRVRRTDRQTDGHSGGLFNSKAD